MENTKKVVCETCGSEEVNHLPKSSFCYGRAADVAAQKARDEAREKQRAAERELLEKNVRELSQKIELQLALKKAVYVRTTDYGEVVYDLTPELRGLGNGGVHIEIKRERSSRWQLSSTTVEARLRFGTWGGLRNTKFENLEKLVRRAVEEAAHARARQVRVVAAEEERAKASRIAEEGQDELAKIGLRPSKHGVTATKRPDGTWEVSATISPRSLKNIDEVAQFIAGIRQL